VLSRCLPRAACTSRPTVDSSVPATGNPPPIPHFSSSTLFSYILSSSHPPYNLSTCLIHRRCWQVSNLHLRRHSSNQRGLYWHVPEYVPWPTNDFVPDTEYTIPHAGTKIGWRNYIEHDLYLQLSFCACWSRLFCSRDSAYVPITR
jgi:hypothetical protein